MGAPSWGGVLTNQGKLDFSYEIKTGGQGVSTRSPVCRTNLVAILVYKFCGTELAEGFRSTAANAKVMDFSGFQNAIGINDKGTTQSKTLVVDVDIKQLADCTGRIGTH